MSDITAADIHTAQGGSDAIESAIDCWAKLKGRRASRSSNKLVGVFIMSLRRSRRQKTEKGGRMSRSNQKGKKEIEVPTLAGSTS
jgi:hypothetical protein